jgi:hypothetical protein
MGTTSRVCDSNLLQLRERHQLRIGEHPIGRLAWLTYVKELRFSRHDLLLHVQK